MEYFSPGDAGDDELDALRFAIYNGTLRGESRALADILQGTYNKNLIKSRIEYLCNDVLEECVERGFGLAKGDRVPMECPICGHHRVEVGRTVDMLTTFECDGSNECGWHHVFDDR